MAGTEVFSKATPSWVAKGNPLQLELLGWSLKRVSHGKPAAFDRLDHRDLHGGRSFLGDGDRHLAAIDQLGTQQLIGVW